MALLVVVAVAVLGATLGTLLRLPAGAMIGALLAVGAAVLQRERGYFRSNAARMASPAFRQQPVPIGSGAVEASAKHLVQHWMKRAGSRRSDLGVRAILDLRCHLLSGRSLERVA